MTIYTERMNKTILSMAGDADGDPLTVLKINGQEALVGVPIALSVGGSVTVTSAGVVTFDDTGFTVPEIGDYVADGLIATITDGTAEVETTVNLELHGAASAGITVFGALTRRFEGGSPAPAGASAIVGGDPDGHFAIADGMILPTLQGEGNLSGSYVLTLDTGDTQEISVLPGVFSVLGDDELAGLLNDAEQPFDGHTIQLRPGQYDKHSVPSVTYEQGGIVITADDASTQMRQLVFNRSYGNPEIVVQGIAFTTDVPETSATNRVFYIPNSTPNGIFRVLDCRFDGHPGVDPSSDIWSAKIDYSGATAVPVAGQRIDNDGGGDAGAYTTIFEVHDNGDGTGTLYIDDNPGKTNGGSADNQGVPWAVGQVMTSDGGWTATLTSELYGGDPTLGNGLEGGHAFDEIYVERCVFTRLNQALEVVATKDVVVRDNVAASLKGDFIKVHCTTGIPPTNQTLIERNLLSKGMVGTSDQSNPHRDGVQFQALTLAQDWENVAIRNNVFWTGFSDRPTFSKATDLQALILTFKNVSGHGLRGAKIENNILDCGSNSHTVTSDFFYSGEVRNNVGVSSLLRNLNDHPGPIKIRLGFSGGDANNIIERNVTEKIEGNDSVPLNNTTADRYFDFSAYYPAWTGVQNFTDLSTLFASLTPGPATSVMAGSTWDRLTDHGCINEAGQFIAHDGTDLTEHFLNLEQTRDGLVSQLQGTAPGAFALSDWSLTDSGAGEALELNVLSLPDNGGSTILDLEVSIDGGSFVSLGGAQPGIYTLSGLTNDTEVTVTLRAVNMFGTGNAGTGQSATPTLGATAPAQFAQSDWSVVDAASGGTLSVTLSTLPDDGGSALTAVEYSVDGGAFSDLGLTVAGDAEISGLSNGVSVDLVLRAVNAIGAGLASAAKSVTPSAGEQPLDESFAADEPAFERMVFDTDRLNGGLTADVPVEVNAPALANTALEGRAIDSAGNTTPWVAIGTADASGVLSSMLLGISRGLNWYKWQIRKASSPSEGGTTAGEFGVGDVLGFFGQSPLDQSFLTDSTPRPLTQAEALTVVTGNDTTVSHLPVTGASPFNESMSYLNDMIATTSDAVCMIVDLAKSGTGRTEWAANSDTDRNWQDDELRILHVQNAGSDISLLYETWHTFDSGNLVSQAVENFVPFYTGMDSTGATVAYGSTVNGTYQLDKSLFDLSGGGRGLLDHTRTKMVMATPFGNAFPPKLNYLLNTNGQIDISLSRVTFMIRDQMELLNADARMQQITAQVGPYATNVRFEDGGAIHLQAGDEFGRPHILRNGLAAMYLANGVIADDYGPTGLNTSEATPEITGVTWETTHVDLQVSVPAGRNLTTTALARGLAPLGTAKPHFAEVMGFEVAQSELHDLLPTGFTAVIHDASAGIIRITPLSGNFEPGARIAYARGPASPVFEESDKAAGTHLYMPIVTCDAGGGYEGFPLRPNVEFAATSIAGVAQSPRVKTQPGLGFSIAQTGTIGAGQGSELTVEFIGALTYTNGTARLISLNASNFVLDVHRNGSVTFSVKGNNGSTVFSENAPNGTIKHGWTGLSARVLHLVATVDLANNEAHVWLKDDTGVFVEILTPSFTTTETEFANNRRFTFGDATSPVARGEFQKFAVYFGKTTNADTSALTPYMIKLPGAANFNSTANAGTGPVFAAPVNPVLDV